jgi:mannose/cellobiose epimerase-like protein (N-acyl-D-glucosamine 2-epimerase family)
MGTTTMALPNSVLLAPSMATLIARDIAPGWTRANDSISGALIDPVGAMRRGARAPVATLSVQAQRIDATAEAALCGLTPASAQRAANLLQRTLQHFLNAESGSGLPSVVDCHGAVVDPTRQLESHAWLLRAVAKVHALTASDELLAVADRIFDFLDKSLLDETGFYRLDSSPSRRAGQRGHLRLLEAALTLHRRSGRPSDFRRAAQLVSLFSDRLLDRSSGGVAEYLDLEAPSARPTFVAGHRPRTSAQWIVALTAFRAQGGDASVAADIAQMRRGMLAAVQDDGFLAETDAPPPRPEARTTELPTQLAFVAALHALDRASETGAANLRRLDRQIAASFLEPAVKGCWIERIDARGGSCGATPRLSTLSSLVGVCGLRDALALGGERPLAFAATERRAGHAA